MPHVSFLIAAVASNAYSSVYNKTLEYVKTFGKFNTTDSASAVREYGLVILSYDHVDHTCLPGRFVENQL